MKSDAYTNIAPLLQLGKTIHRVAAFARKVALNSFKRPMALLAGALSLQSTSARASDLGRYQNESGVVDSGDNQFFVDFGQPSIEVFADPLHQGFRTPISIQAFLVNGNPETKMTFFGGDPLPTWAQFEPSGPIFLGSLSLNSTYDPLARAYSTVHQGLVYFADGGSGLYIVDISDPYSPKPIGRSNSTGPYDARAVVVGDDHLAYLANGVWGWMIIDVSQANSPRVIYNNHTLPQGSTSIYGVQGIEYYAGRVYLACMGLMVFDVENPNSPVMHAYYPLSRDTWSVSVDFPYAYVTGDADGFLSSFRVNGSKIDLLDRFEFSTTGITNMERLDKSLLVSTQDNGLTILNISDPSRVTFSGKYLYNKSEHQPVYDVAILDLNRLIIAKPNHLVILNITNLRNPTFAGEVQLNTERVDLCIGEDGTVIATDSRNRGIQLLSNHFMLGNLVTSPVPYQRNRVDLRLMLSVSSSNGSDSNYASTQFTLKVGDQKPTFRSVIPKLEASIPSELFFDLTLYDPDGDLITVDLISSVSHLTSRYSVLDNSPVHIASFDLDGSAALGLGTGVAFSDDYLYFAYGHLGLYVISPNSTFGNLTLQEVGHFPEQASQKINYVDVSVYDGKAAVVDSQAGLSVLDVAEPTDPSLRYPIKDLSAPYDFGVLVRNDTLFVADIHSGLHIYDISSDVKPSLVYQNSTILGSRVLEDDGYIYIAANDSRPGVWYGRWSSELPEFYISQQPVTEPMGILAVGNHTLFALGKNLHIYEIDTNISSTLRYQTTHPLISHAHSSIVYNDPTNRKTLLFVGLGYWGLQVLDVTTSEAPFTIAHLSDPSGQINVEAMLAIEDNLFFASGKLGLQVFNSSFGWYSTHRVSAKFQSGDQGTSSLIIRATAFDSSVETLAQVVVHDTPPCTRSNYTGHLNVRVGEIVNFNLNRWFTDPDGDPLSFEVFLENGVSIDAANSWLKLNNQHTLFGKPSVADHGIAGRVKVSDPYNKEITADIHVHIYASELDELNYNARQFISNHATISTLATLVIASLIVLITYLFRLHRRAVIDNSIIELLDSLIRKESEIFRELQIEGREAQTPLSYDAELKIALQELIAYFPSRDLDNQRAVMGRFEKAAQRHVFLSRERDNFHQQTMWPILLKIGAFQDMQESLKSLLLNQVYNEHTLWYSQVIRCVFWYALQSQVSTFKPSIETKRSCCSRLCSGVKPKLQRVSRKQKERLLSDLLSLLSSARTEDDDDDRLLNLKIQVILQLRLAVQFARCIPDDGGTTAVLFSAIKNLVNLSVVDLVTDLHQMVRFSPRIEFIRTLKLLLLSDILEKRSDSSSKVDLLIKLAAGLERDDMAFQPLVLREAEDSIQVELISMLALKGGSESAFRSLVVNDSSSKKQSEKILRAGLFSAKCCRRLFGVYRHQGSKDFHLVFIQKLILSLQEDSLSTENVSKTLEDREKVLDQLKNYKPSGRGRYRRSLLFSTWLANKFFCGKQETLCGFSGCPRRIPERDRFLRKVANYYIRALGGETEPQSASMQRVDSDREYSEIDDLREPLVAQSTTSAITLGRESGSILGSAQLAEEQLVLPISVAGGLFARRRYTFSAPEEKAPPQPASLRPTVSDGGSDGVHIVRTTLEMTDISHPPGPPAPSHP